MRTNLALVVLAALVTACGPPAPSASPVAEAAAPAATTPAAAPGFETLDPCRFTGAELSAAIGVRFADGVNNTDPRVASAQQSCNYEGPDHAAVLLHVVLLGHDPATVAASRRMMLQMIAGKTETLTDDVDAAIFQDQSELGTYALHYARGDYLYEVRLLAFQGGAASARQKLARLRRL